MPIELHPKEALITAAKTAKRPAAFLVGAPLSADGAGGVPGVAQMLDLVRNEIRGTAASELNRFEKYIDGKAGAEAYQAAMRWLQGNLTQDAVNRVIEQAVMRARKAGVAAAFQRDGDPSDWQLPAGTRQLAALTCGDIERFPGPILTTNFDPLISLAIRAAGGRARLRVIDSDGGLARTVETEPGIAEVVHLHGYWRDSDTLHTPAQLTSARPKLKASLQGVLRQRTLIVAGYGGWDDVVSAALVELLNDDEAQLNVLWCFHESDAGIIEIRYKRLLERVAPAITRGRFLTYGGIDCHSIFGDIGGFPATAHEATSIAVCPLAGWEQVDAAYLASLVPLRPEEAVRYFDGAQPTWRHAISDSIPRRQVLSEIISRLNSTLSAKDASSLQLIRAAGGEGKSTLLLQAAVDAVQSGNWTVLWRPSPNIGIASEGIVNLDQTRRWLIVADDAENLVQALKSCARALHALGRVNVHFLLAARDADWRAARGDRENHDSYLKLQLPIVLRGISAKDADALVAGWARCGAAALRALSNLSDHDKQVETFVRAVTDASKQRDEGSLFGGLLAVRFGQQGLRAHVREFLGRLQDVKIEGNDNSLFDAIIYVAACHAVGIPGINENVLADLLSVPRLWIRSRVIRPLGEEAAGTGTANYVFTRHREVANAILVEAEASFGNDIAEVWRALVLTTVKTGRQIHFGDRSFPMTVHAGPLLQRGLPPQFPAKRRNEIAIAAAKASIEVDPNRLSFVVDFGKTFRLAGDLLEAVQVFRKGSPKARSKIDSDEVIRGYWYEWGICEGSVKNDSSRRGADVWLQGLSLSDYLKPAPITEERAKISCAGLGLTLGKLAQPRADCPFARARRAVVYLGMKTKLDPTTERYLKNHSRELDQVGTPHPHDIEEAVTWLSTAIAGAGRELEDSFLKSLIAPEQVSFGMLQRFLKSIRGAS